MSTFVTMLHKETYPYAQVRRIGAALLCLGLFISGQLSVPFQHYLDHSAAHEILHDQQAEADACHQAIFHAGSNAACEHPAHLTATHTDCELCDYLLQFTDFRLLTVELSAPKFIQQSLFTFLSLTDGNPILLAAARGPPCLL